jgi:hypothetical protein
LGTWMAMLIIQTIGWQFHFWHTQCRQPCFAG